MWKPSQSYKLLSGVIKDKQEEDNLFEQKEDYLSSRISLPFWHKVLLVVLFGLTIVFLAILISRRENRNLISSQLLYSQDAIQYEIKKFHRGFGKDMTIYQQDPSPDVDQAWLDLYETIGIIRIPKSQAERLPKKTYPFVGDEGYYIGELAVFHQLHCINAIRIALSKDYYQEILNPIDFDDTEGSYGKDHIRHCVDALREAVMCASDISVITWKWNSRAQKALGHGDIVHSCRSFDSIRDWSTTNKAIIDFDNEVYTEDALELID